MVQARFDPCGPCNYAYVSTASTYEVGMVSIDMRRPGAEVSVLQIDEGLIFRLGVRSCSTTDFFYLLLKPLRPSSVSISVLLRAKKKPLYAGR